MQQFLIRILLFFAVMVAQAACGIAATKKFKVVM